jgi:membrane fusion protein, multidrug efflux system
MRIPALILAVAAGTLLFALASAQDGGSQSSKQETRQSADKVKELQKERIATLKAMTDVETRLHQNGKASPEAVLEARVLVCEAELDAAEKESDRITVLRNLVEVLKEHEEVAKARKKSAEGTEVSVLKVKARRLEAEIRLERAQAQEQAKNVEPEHEKVVVTSPQAKDVVVTQQFACQLQSRRHIDVRSQQSGYLEEVQVKEGQAVKQGEVIFKVEPLLYKAKLDAELAEVELAALNLKNTERLFQNKVVSVDEVALLRAKLASAQAKAKLAQAELDLTMVRAPFDGIIDRLQVQQGSLVTERDILTTLSDNSVMWVYFNVPQARYLEYMANPAKDQAGETELVLADGRKFPQPGKIAAIEAEFNKKTGNIPFRADFPNPDGLLRHGMTGIVLIHQTLSNAIVIPQRATFETLGKRYVYVVDTQDVVHQREIVIQNELDDLFVVNKGVGVDEKIVLEGAQCVRDGDKVEYKVDPPQPVLRN